jgi:hypothetical protein
MAARAAAPWPGADGVRELPSRFNRQDSYGPTQPPVKSRGFSLQLRPQHAAPPQITATIGLVGYPDSHAGVVERLHTGINLAVVELLQDAL